MTWPQPISDYWRAPYEFLANVLPAPRIRLQRGPKMDRDARKKRERERMRKHRAKEVARRVVRA